jgi:hypothetical protein
MQRPSYKFIPRLLIPSLLVALALIARLVPGPRTIDDAYITFRYARNILSGEGFVFNPGQRVMGTTTELYTLLMAGLGALAGGPKADFPWIALLVNALADAGTALLLWRIGKKAGFELAGVAAGLAWGIAPFSVTFAIGGLETSVYVFLLTLAVWAYLTRRGWLTALAAALSLLTRPDALILLGPLAFDWLVRGFRRKEERVRFRDILIAVLPVAAWLIFATLYFGSPVPHSVQAKLGAYRLGPEEGLVRLLQHYATPFLWQNWLPTPLAVGLGMVFFSFLSFVGIFRLVRTESRLAAWAAYPWLYLIVFAAANPLIFRWYLTPPLPAYFFFIFAGLEDILRRIAGMRRALPARAWLRGLLVLLFFAPMIGGLLSEWRLRLDHGPQRPAPEMAFIKLELLYRQAAEQIAPRLSGQSVLAAGDVGVLGYYTPARILDLVGLNSPEALQYYPLDEKYYAINYAVAPEMILDHQPDALVILEVYGRLGLLRDERFTSAYALEETLHTDIYGSQGMLIYWKK